MVTSDLETKACFLIYCFRERVRLMHAPGKDKRYTRLGMCSVPRGVGRSGAYTAGNKVNVEIEPTNATHRRTHRYMEFYSEGVHSKI